VTKRSGRLGGVLKGARACVILGVWKEVRQMIDLFLSLNVGIQRKGLLSQLIVSLESAFHYVCRIAKDQITFSFTLFVNFSGSNLLM
jgi:hypothetical protein